MKGFFLSILFILNSVLAFAHQEKWDENKEEWSSLMIAIYNGKNDEVRELIGQNTNINFITSGKDSNWRLTALDVAIYTNNEYAAELLLLTNKISKPDRFIMTASKQQSANTVLLLLKYGANPNEILSNGYSVLMTAVSFGALEIVECLLNNGANVNQKREADGMTPLMFATINGDVKKVKLLLAYGADKSSKDKNNNIALNYVNLIPDRLQISHSTKNELRKILR